MTSTASITLPSLGESVMICCPAHDDQKASLSLKNEAGKILVHCFAGCSFHKIAKAMGRPASDFSPNDVGKASPKKISTIYDYTDENGQLLFQVVRFEPKNFRQRRPDEKGGWVWDLKNVQTVLYKLPEVLKAQSVLIVEGEKDVETAYRLGLPGGWAATTSPMGATKWKPQYTKALRGKSVFLLPDNDEPGRKHVEGIAKNLWRDYQKDEAPTTRIVALPDAHDLTAWVEAGGTTEQFHGLLDTATTWKPIKVPDTIPTGNRTLSLMSADTIKPESTTWVYEGRIPEKDITVICGDPDVGKSMITHYLAARWTRGQLPGAYKGVPVNVVLASAEDSASHTIIPRFIAAGGDRTKLHIIKTEVDGYDGGGFELPGDLSLLVNESKRVGAKILIIDPLMSHLSSKLNSNNDQHIRQALGGLPEFAAANDMTFIIVCHLNKNEAGNVKYRIGGSLGIFAVPRSVLLAGEDPEDEEKYVLVHSKCNVGEKTPSLSYALEKRQIEVDGHTIETGGVVWYGERDGVTAESILGHKKDPEAQSLLDEAKEWLAGFLERGAVGSKECLLEAKKQGHSETTIKRARRALGVISKRDGFLKNAHWVWRLPHEGGHEGGQTPDLDPLRGNIGENGQKAQQNTEGGQDSQVDPLREKNTLIPDLFAEAEEAKIDY